MDTTTMTTSGLEGVVVAETRLSEVDGERGRLVVAGHDIEQLAGRVTFEDLAALLWSGSLPDADGREAQRRALAAGRVAAFERLGLRYVPSFGNFVLVKVGDDDGAGARVNLALLKQGVIVRPVGNYGLPQWLRISIGLPRENATCIAALEKALG